MKHLYKDKTVNYYSTVRKDLLNFLPENSCQKVLEVGAARGDTLVALKENKLAELVVGIDLFQMPGTNQTNPLIDKFIIADIEKDELTELERNYFDVVICGDVLEHLIDPWAAVEKLKGYLKKGGIFIASIPNIRHISVLNKIIFHGDFRYDRAGGLLDKTHLRFFCKKNAIDLFKNNDFDSVEYCASFLNYKPLNNSKILNMATFRIFEEFITLQHLVISRK